MNAMGSKHYKNCTLFKNHRGLRIKTKTLVDQKIKSVMNNSACLQSFGICKILLYVRNKSRCDKKMGISKVLTTNGVS